MGKRSDFARVPHDFYVTPWDAVRPLLPHLPSRSDFVEPCAGNGALVDHLESVGHRCVGKIDINPQRADIKRASCHAMTWRNPTGFFITNPPWTRAVMHPILMHLCRQAPTWALFDAGWMHTVQSTALLDSLRKIVSVGRVKWIPGTDSVGKDDCCWHLLDGRRAPSAIEFCGRTP